MAEYIVEYPDDLVAEGYVKECINIHERIVRCRDCKHLVNPPDYDLKPYCVSHHEGYAIPPNTAKRVKPDGFCAWGERRDDA